MNCINRVVLLILLLLKSGNGEELCLFEDEVEVEAGFTNARFLAAADIKSGDGIKDDLIVTSLFGPLIWMENVNGDGSNFVITQMKPKLTNIGIIIFLSTADLDSDGDSDLIYVAPADRIVAYFKNEGDGIFSEEDALIYFEENSNSILKAVSTADINGDGYEDVVILGSVGINVLLNDGNGSFTIGNSLEFETEAASIVTGDINGDTFVDIVVPAFTDTNEIIWYSNNGDTLVAGATPTFTKNVVGSISKTPIFALLVDLDGDDDLDVIACDSNNIFWFENDGFGSFTKNLVASSDVVSFRLIYAIDIDTDGDIDLIAVDKTSPQKTLIYLNDDSEAFSLEASLSVTSDPFATVTSVTALDVTGDSKLDIVASRYSRTTKTVIYYDQITCSTSPTIEPTPIPTALPTPIPTAAPTTACSIIVRLCLDLDVPPNGDCDTDGECECNNDDLGIELPENAVQLLVNDDVTYGPKKTGPNGYATFPAFQDEFAVQPGDKNVISVLGLDVLNRGADKEENRNKISVLGSNSYELKQDDFLLRNNGKCQAWVQFPIAKCKIVVLLCLDANGNMQCDNDEDGVEDLLVEISLDGMPVSQGATGANGYTTFSDDVTYAKDNYYNISVPNLDGMYLLHEKPNGKSSNGKKVWIRESSTYTLESEDFYIDINGECRANIQYPLLYIPTSSPTVAPTAIPTAEPSTEPSSAPTDAPTPAPTPLPTGTPTAAPTTPLDAVSFSAILSNFDACIDEGILCAAAEEYLENIPEMIKCSCDENTDAGTRRSLRGKKHGRGDGGGDDHGGRNNNEDESDEGRRGGSGVQVLFTAATTSIEDLKDVVDIVSNDIKNKKDGSSSLQRKLQMQGGELSCAKVRNLEITSIDTDSCACCDERRRQLGKSGRGNGGRGGRGGRGGNGGRGTAGGRGNGGGKDDCWCCLDDSE